MVRVSERRSLALLAGAALLVVAVGAVGGVAAWRANPQGAPPLSSRGTSSRVSTPPPAVTAMPSAPGIALVQLAAQDLTPRAHLSVMASGFLPNEQLVATIADAQGTTYEQVSLSAKSDGSVHESNFALPPQLGSGEYQLRVVGSTSHRAARATFRMHVVPPTLALDTYTSEPGQALRFAGDGFIPGESVTVYLGTSSSPLASVQATQRGAVTGLLAVPALTAGTYTLSLVGAQSQTPATVQFTIGRYTPWVVLNRYTLAPQQGMGFIGKGFSPGEPVLVYVNSATGTPALRLTADLAGQIVAQDSWTPPGVSGRNTLTFVGQQSHATTTVEFTILAAPQPASSSTTPAPAP